MHRLLMLTLVSALCSFALVACGDDSDTTSSESATAAPAATDAAPAPQTVADDDASDDTSSEEPAKSKRVPALHGVKRQPIDPDTDPVDPKAETETIRYIDSIGGVDRWNLVEIDADDPVLTLTTGDVNDSKSGLGLCTAAMDAEGDGVPEWDRIIVLDGDSNPIAMKAPGAEICRSLIG